MQVCESRTDRFPAFKRRPSGNEEKQHRSNRHWQGVLSSHYDSFHRGRPYPKIKKKRKRKANKQRKNKQKEKREVTRGGRAGGGGKGSEGFMDLR